MVLPPPIPAWALSRDRHPYEIVGALTPQGGKLKMRHVAGGSAVGVRLPWGRRLLGAAAPGVDLASAADWSRCAVVGSSSSLSGENKTPSPSAAKPTLYLCYRIHFL